MIENGKNSNAEARKSHIDNLSQIVQYCINRRKCRRAQQISYFKQHNVTYCKKDSDTMCDNCMLNKKVSCE